MNYRNVRINTVAALVLSLSAAAFFAFGRLFFGVGGWLIFYSIPAGLFVALLLIALWFIPVRGGKAGLEAGLFKSFGWRESWAFIAVTVFLFLSGFFMVDFGDTEDSIKSVFTQLVGLWALDLSWILCLLSILGVVVSYIVGVVVSAKGRKGGAQAATKHD